MPPNKKSKMSSSLTEREKKERRTGVLPSDRSRGGVHGQGRESVVVARIEGKLSGEWELEGRGGLSRVLGSVMIVLQRQTDERVEVVVSSGRERRGVVVGVEMEWEESIEGVLEKVVEQLDQPVLVDLSQVDHSTVRLINHPQPDAPPSPADLSILLNLPNLTLLYNSILFDKHRIQFLVDQTQSVIDQLTSIPLLKFSSLSLLSPNQSQVLPNPSDHLHWSTWPGPITHIFAANAIAHPQNICVIEHILDAQNPIRSCRSFDYASIHHASNLLAHHLIKHNILPEDVVTIYSTRGVDLVVAILAILKAGATFSVIDPAYPPQRQIIYLDVSKPRALIILKRAGNLLPQVHSFISDHLSLKLTVPALALHDDGSLHGGLLNSNDPHDCLHDSQALASLMPDVILGPDSIATLSFTSGSTGIPKGVRGRHFSLTHFFPWMANQFNLDHSSKFTMLSGIAHDPIQRDIFTPLFLAAELHIPSPEDIGTPGQLAEWIDDNKLTVTHLTPAMGQLLSAQASRQIPSLKNAFFVGDVLTKRDCSRLQHLAPNVDIINMFGTTETQRAVSYHLIPSIAKDPIYLESKKDIIPAGKGMQDVQLLVVNRRNKTLQCAVGELGEIYVRSSGLAEGYLGPPEMSAEKFMLNWFPSPASQLSTTETEIVGKWLGVRDRLYRTGDLGRYLPDGTVECVGRMDDQIKIRGFRIELGEIDTHLSQHPLIRENVTLVRRDKDEEKILVSYFVPMENGTIDMPAVSEVEDEDEDEGKDGEVCQVDKGIRKYRKLIKSIREYLKTKLPSYSIPTLFVPLVRMPLNPNGKIDKPALPFPDTALQAALRAKTSLKPDQLTPSEAAMASIWAGLLPKNVYSSSTIPPDESFFDLGGHSILATRLVFEIRRAMAVNVPLGLVFEHPTIRSLAAQVDRCRKSDFGLAREDEEEEPSSATPATHHQQSAVGQTFDYAADARALIKTLKPSYAAPGPPTGPQTVLLTGATGFLGAFILKELLATGPIGTVICHVRAKTKEAGLARLRESCQSRGVWDEHWLTEGRIEVVLGDLEARQIGVGDGMWQELSERVDIVVHNGALVHWVYPYSKLRAANVMGTVGVMELVGMGKPKGVVFVSSTAVLETDEYVRLSDRLVEQGLGGVPETDGLEGSAHGLTAGYGQTKWVSERLLAEAGRRGMRGAVIRPAYILGDARTGVSNTDDFLWRLAKGCVQIGAVPDIDNTFNMLPVNHVARVVVLAALEPDTRLEVYHLTARPLPRFSTFLDTLSQYGYAVEKQDYLSWRVRLEESIVGAAPADNALFPLLHYVLNDLPSSTKSAELDDARTAGLLCKHGHEAHVSISSEDLGVYIAWLVQVGYLPSPTQDLGEGEGEGQGHGRLKLPVIEGLDEKMKMAIGRSGH